MTRWMSRPPNATRRALFEQALFFGLILACACLLGSCNNGPRAPRPLVQGPPRSDAPLVRVVTPGHVEAIPLVDSLRSELRGDFDVQVTVVSATTEPEELADVLHDDPPVAVVLIDNSVATLYRRSIRGRSSVPPSVLVMTSFVEDIQPTIANSTAISYEPPAVVSLTHLRTLLGRPIERAGLLYRKGFEAFVRREATRARQEKIELVAIPLSEDPSENAVGRALHRLERARIDAVWITNDNALLTRGTLARAWLPFAKKSKLPIVVGVPSLVARDGSFGTYAAVPDAEGLGLQAAELIYALEERRFRASEQPIQPPVSMKTYLNVTSARRLGAPSESEARVDVLVGE